MQRERLSEEPNYKGVDEARLHRADIGERYWKADLYNPPVAEVPYGKKVTDYFAAMHELERHGCGMLLYGPHGSGKTSAACRYLIEAMARAPVQARFVSADDIDWLSTNRREETREGARMWDLVVRDAQFLVIDDLGAEDDAEWKSPAVAHVLSQRYNRKLSTVITTNLKPEALYKRCPRLGQLSVEVYEEIEVSGVRWRG